MNRRASTLTVLTGLVLGVTGAWVAEGAAAGSSTVPHSATSVSGPIGSAATTFRVRGTQLPVNPDKGTYTMRGDLVGRWTVTPAKVLHDTPALYVEAGQEQFVGCLDRNHDEVCQVTEPHGVLRSSYIYWASFTGNGQLVRGRWVHPVTGGTAAFESARGVINMVATPVGYSVRTTYSGRVVLLPTPPTTPHLAASPAMSSVK
jgi:hypothetical protein